jgi:hypothetical protein
MNNRQGQGGGEQKNNSKLRDKEIRTDFELERGRLGGTCREREIEIKTSHITELFRIIKVDEVCASNPPPILEASYIIISWYIFEALENYYHYFEKKSHTSET